MSTTAKKPQDHKAPDGYAFTVKGKRYVLPKVTAEMAGQVPGAITYAAVMNPDDSMAQARLGLANLEVCGATPAAKKALLSLTTEAMMEIVGEWLGESLGSSD